MFAMKYYALVVLICVILGVFCQLDGDKTCKKHGFPRYTCQAWNKCVNGSDMINKRIAIHCGFEPPKVPKICCPPPIDERLSSVPVSSTYKNSVDIATKKCQEYAKYRYKNLTIPGLLKGDPPTIVPVLDCVPVEELIVGGTEASLKEYPHMALIGYGDVKNIEWACGGSLISERFILSAAHCDFSSLSLAQWVLLGELNTITNIDGAKPKTFSIEKRFHHPDYKSPLQYNDLVLYQLNATVALNPYVRPTCLFTSLVIPKREKKVSATGWGTTGTVDSTSDHLLKTVLNLESDDRCKASYANDPRYDKGYDPRSMVCAGDSVTGNDTCKGDSGGPIQFPSRNLSCMWYQVGITSVGPTFCGDTEVPAIYTRVANYIDWIVPIVWPQNSV